MSAQTNNGLKADVRFDFPSPMIGTMNVDLTVDEVKERYEKMWKKQLKNTLRRQLKCLIMPETDTEDKIREVVISRIRKSELDWGGRDEIWPRVLNTLEEFDRLVLKDSSATPECQVDQFNDAREALFELLYDKDEKYVTTPALLVVQAILYAHIE